MVAVLLSAAGAIVVGALALAAKAQAWALLAGLLLGVGAFSAWCLRCTRTCAATTSSTSLPLPKNRDAIDAAWLTLAFQESGLLGLEQRVASVELGDFAKGGVGGGGAALIRAQLEYSGDGDLKSLPQTVVIKLADLDSTGEAGLPRAQLLYKYATGYLNRLGTLKEHSMYRYLRSDEVRKQPWALKAPAIYFQAIANWPTEQPSEAAILLLGAMAGPAPPGARAVLIMEDISEGLQEVPTGLAPGGLWIDLGLDPLKRTILEPLARWHAANWGCLDAAAAALPLSHGDSERAKDCWALMRWWQALANLARLKMRRTPSGPCPFVDAVCDALETVYRPRKRPVVEALKRPGVLAALRGLERAYGPLLVHMVRERLLDGATAARNRTLTHGDLHNRNCLMRCSPEAGQDAGKYSDPHFVDFERAGRAHATIDLLSYMFQYYPTGPVLQAYHASLAAALPEAVSYSWGDLIEDWSLAVVSRACEYLVILSMPQLYAADVRLLGLWMARVLILLEEVLHSDTKVGAILREASVAGAGEGPRPEVDKTPWPTYAYAGKGQSAGAQGKAGGAQGGRGKGAGRGSQVGGGKPGKGAGMGAQKGEGPAAAAAQAVAKGGVRPCKTPGCPFQATWHPTLCCAICEQGKHGPRCEKKGHCLPVGASATSGG